MWAVFGVVFVILVAPALVTLTLWSGDHDD
jgi:hypothetical protein